ncbi:MAG: hypothetical protein AAGH99_14475 [Planctomycetota bacterium]
MLIQPPGLEDFFDEVDQATSESPAEQKQMEAIATKYGVTVFLES